MTAAPARNPMALFTLDDPEAADPRVAGQKAARLATLRVAGFDIPDGLIVPASVCARWPADAEATVSAVMAQLRGPLAVRSSAVAEDLADASFAGMYTTVLGVASPEALARAIADVVASARSERVLAYYGRQSEIAVLIQPLVEAECAGVAFTADPITGERDVVVVAAVEGLGDALVSGEADPEEWDVRDGPTCRQTARVLTDAQASTIADLARRVAEHDGEPRDIEWALRDDKVWLLQARPITSLPIEPEYPEMGPGTWMKDSAHLSEPMTPFGASIYGKAVEEGGAAAFAEFGLVVERLEVKMRAGEFYGRVCPVGAKPGAAGPPPPAFLIGLLARIVPALRARMKAARDAIAQGKLQSVVDEWDGGLRERFGQQARALLAEDVDVLDDAALLDHLERGRALLERGERAHFRLFIPYAVAIAELAIACRDLLGWETLDTMRLLTGLSTASAEPTRALAELADQARADAAVVDALRGLVDVVDLEAASPSFADSFRGFIQTHAHRSIAYDCGTPTLAERPRLLARLVVDRIDREERDGSDESTRAAAESEARAALADRPDGLERFADLLEHARRIYPVREDNVALTDNVPNGLLRRALMAAGRRLVQRGRLRRADDARFLTFDEVPRALADDTTDWIAITDRRCAEERWVRAHPGPEFIGPPPAPPPDPKWLPAAARRINTALLWMLDQELTPPQAAADGPILRGRPGSPGRVRGPARIIRSEADFHKLQPGDILVCPITSPVWSVLFANAAALVTDAGGAMSHAAIIAREHAIPAVLSTARATHHLQDGQWITVDGTQGHVIPD